MAGTDFTNKTNGEFIIKDYKFTVYDRILRYSKIAGIVSFIFPTYYIYQDIKANFPFSTLLWRILPIVIGAILFVFSMTVLKKHIRFITLLYNLFLLSLMVMMCGIFIESIGTPVFSPVTSGLVFIIIIIFIGAPGGMRQLVPIYGLPMAATIGYIAIFKNPTANELLYLPLPVIIIIVNSFLAEVLERLRYREFEAKRSAEYNNMILEDKNKQLNEELMLARSLQQKLIPQEMPEIKGIKVSALYKPFIEVSGDFYDFIYFRNQDKMGIFICDVSGHGVSAALIASMTKAIILTARHEISSPSDLLKYINSKISGHTGGQFISAIYAIYEYDTNKFIFARAGHPYPLIIRQDSVMPVKSKGSVLGIMTEREYEEKTIDLQHGDKVIFYTDGLSEAVNSEFEVFENVMNDVLLKHKEEPIDKYINSLHEELIIFKGLNTKYDDDICIVGFEIL